MPEHTSFFHYLLDLFPALKTNASRMGATVLNHKPASVDTLEPLVGVLFIVLLLIGLAYKVRGSLGDIKDNVIPEDKLTLRTFFELVIGYFYGLMKEMMGAKKAKRYFPLIGTCALFILTSNFLGMVPGMPLVTSSWTVTVACAAIVFIAFNYYGLKENGFGYVKHLAGPVWWLSPLMFPLEVFSTCLRPVTLSVRLMLNMSVDHLLLSLALGAFVLLVPIPVMILGTLVCVVQALVFCLLSSIYISLATEHEEHEGHGHAEHAH